MPEDVIDLTQNSDSDEKPARKRRRCQMAGGSRLEPEYEAGDLRAARKKRRSQLTGGIKLEPEYEDGDVVVVEPVREGLQPRPSVVHVDLGDADLVITGATGQARPPPGYLGSLTIQSSILKGSSTLHGCTHTGSYEGPGAPAARLCMSPVYCGDIHLQCVALPSGMSAFFLIPVWLHAYVYELKYPPLTCVGLACM